MIPGVVGDRLAFYVEALRATNEVGAVSPTSAVVARAMAEVLDDYPSPRRILEVGPGTGALTRALLPKLGAGDRLELYEINERFAELLGRELAQREEVAVVCDDVERLTGDARYHVIVSSLPLMNFEPEKVRRILAAYEERLEPGGTVTSFDYWANGIRAWLGRAAERHRIREVMRIVADFNARHAHVSRLFLWNVPPARVHRVRIAGH